MPRRRVGDLRELVDAYLAGASGLDVSEAWEAVEDYLDRIAVVHGFEVDDALARAERALPDWRPSAAAADRRA